MAALSLCFLLSAFYRRPSMLLLWLLLLVPVDAQNQSDEVQTLLEFKNMASVDSGAISLGYWSTWNGTDKTPCAWMGVTCTESSTVEQLDFSFWGVTELPSLRVLSNLTHLRELDLSFNNFASSNGIPEDVGSLVGLTRLSLQVSEFPGPIPSNISACRNLQYLNLESNALTGEIPDLSGLVSLKHLSLRWNNLSGPFPKWLGKLNNLLVIRLSNNSLLSGVIPSLSNLTNLLEVVLENCSFTGFDEPVFPDSKMLTHLSVPGNQLTGPIPSSITKFLNLRNLVLARNQLSGEIPPGLYLNMSQASWIDFSQNQLSGSIPESLLQPTTRANDLPGLVLNQNFLTGHIPFDETQQYCYDTLDFSNNNLSGPVPSICKNGTSYTYVRVFHVQNNNLSGDITDFLLECYDHITDMQLANNSFYGDLSGMGNIDTRSDLAIREANLQNGIRDISNCNIQMRATEVNPDPLRTMLEFFVLNTSVTEFLMPGNNFSGTPLPRYFSLPASSLQVLDLSNNHLIGEISAAAFNSTWLPTLQVLDLSNNDITGPVPEAIVILPNLETLDLINNSLSGPLPSIPPDRLNPSFFAGNGGLCGGPLHTCSHPLGTKWWLLLAVIGGSIIIIVLGSCLIVTWRWRVYKKMHQQDADLIKTLLDRESASLMSLRELKKATDNFAESAQIGAGGFGTVYTGKLSDGTRVAIKRSKREGTEKDKNQFLNEVKILSQVNHRHLVKLLGCCMENKIALLVFEFVSNGTLQEHLQGDFGEVRLSWKQRLRIAVQTADALNYLHSGTTLPIYHRDVKSANILLDNDLHAKVADFGISRLNTLEGTHVSTVAIQGTIGYIDPEYYTSYQLTDKSDVYSFGVVLLELISAKPAIDFQRGGEETGLVNFANPYIESGDLQVVIDTALMETYNDLTGHGRESILNMGRIAKKCLQMRSKARPSMHEVWKDLQSMWLELDDSCKDLGSIREYVNIRSPQPDHVVLLSDSLSSTSSSSRVHNDTTNIQMALFSHLAKERSQSR